MNNIKMEAKIIFESYATLAFRRALEYAGQDGFVASMPQLLHARANASYDNIIWNTWFRANSEENVVTTKKGNHVVVTVHGGGIFETSDRFERSLRADLSRHNSEGLTGQYAVKISETEAHDLLEGKLPGGREIPIYPFAEFKKGIMDLPRCYGVVLDFDIAKNGKSGYVSFDDLKDDPNMIVRAGGVESLSAYLKKAQARHNTDLLGNWHDHNRIDPSQFQSHILSLGSNKGGVDSEGREQGSLGWGYGADDGIRATWPAGLARYVAVAHCDDSTSLSDLDFEL